MIAADTNVVVRLLVNDDRVQARKAAAPASGRPAAAAAADKPAADKPAASRPKKSGRNVRVS